MRIKDPTWWMSARVVAHCKKRYDGVDQKQKGVLFKRSHFEPSSCAHPTLTVIQLNWLLFLTCDVNCGNKCLNRKPIHHFSECSECRAAILYSTCFVIHEWPCLFYWNQPSIFVLPGNEERNNGWMLQRKRCRQYEYCNTCLYTFTTTTINLK